MSSVFFAALASNSMAFSVCLREARFIEFGLSEAMAQSMTDMVPTRNATSSVQRRILRLGAAHSQFADLLSQTRVSLDNFGHQQKPGAIPSSIDLFAGLNSPTVSRKFL